MFTFSSDARAQPLQQPTLVIHLPKLFVHLAHPEDLKRRFPEPPLPKPVLTGFHILVNELMIP
jgi:hypothetical protein